MSMRKGFSLVELSIVLAIIGLLTGGILAGQSLIKGGKIRGTISELQQVQVAAANYVAKYDAFPGDQKDAFSYFGTSCAATAAACNGGGDGLVNDWTYEYHNFWVHLRNAGLLNMTAATDSASRMKTKIDNAVLYAFEDGYYWNGPNRNAVIFTRLGTQGASWQEGGLIPENAWQIDKKIDDGFAQNGGFRGFNGLDDASGGTTETCLTAAPYEYVVSNSTTQTCWSLYMID